jgi:biopolymer transport protein ExbD
MAFNLPSDGDDEILSQINTTPLVDVMLVLLIIFLITIPVVTTSVKVKLPTETNVPRQQKPETVIISVNAKGQIYVFDSLIPNNEVLSKTLKPYAELTPQPDVQIRGDAKSEFKNIGRVMYTVQRLGISKIGFVTEPNS